MTRRNIPEELREMYTNTKPVSYGRKRRNQMPGVDLTDPKVLEHIFTYHAPSEADRICYERIRKAALDFATVLVHNTPKCADQSAAIRHVRDAVMVANAAVALKGLV